MIANPCFIYRIWWASRESNTAPTDYESAALTKHELEAQGVADALGTG